MAIANGCGVIVVSIAPPVSLACMCRPSFNKDSSAIGPRAFSIGHQASEKSHSRGDGVLKPGRRVLDVLQALSNRLQVRSAGQHFPLYFCECCLEAATAAGHCRSLAELRLDLLELWVVLVRTSAGLLQLIEDLDFLGLPFLYGCCLHLEVSKRPPERILGHGIEGISSDRPHSLHASERLLRLGLEPVDRVNHASYRRSAAAACISGIGSLGRSRQVREARSYVEGSNIGPGLHT
mmetsp:Transcript_131761/g.294837  ORF Transcript_131761/g.294837 Transcript_131761/m.294837 type:complete len:236 (-) Transcript_131761:299-1006(-)